MPDRTGRGGPRDEDDLGEQPSRRPRRAADDDEPEPGGYGHSRGKRASESDYEEPEDSRSSRSRDGGRRGGTRFDWGAADREGEPRRREAPAETPRRAPRRGVAREQRDDTKTLLGACTPVFGYATMLPRVPEDPQPNFEQFRRRVVEEIRLIERQAPDHGIDPQDAADAAYALCLFIDEQVHDSAWVGRDAWSAEPLHLAISGDPEGGIHFFDRLEAMGDRQKDVKAVYLTCLAFGYRGMYADHDESQQAIELMEIRERLIAGIRSTPMERRNELFPEAYKKAPPVEPDVPPPPRLWVIGSFVVCAVALAAMIFMWIHSGARAESAKRRIDRAVREFQEQGAAAPQDGTAPAGGDRP